MSAAREYPRHLEPRGNSGEAMNTNEDDWAERYRQAGISWADLEAAASILEDTKSAVLAQRMAELGDMPVNRAENTIKATPRWREHVESIVEARKKANAAKVELEYARMKFQQRMNFDANNRAEMKLV